VRKTVLVLALLLSGTGAASAQTATGGRLGTGMPVPRYVSLKTDRVNLREGPSKDHRTAWVYQRSGLPVEIVAEYETWRRIRDAEGTEGWVLHSLLSGRRTAQVMPWAKDRAQPIPLLYRPDAKAAVLARLEPGVVTSVKSCSGGWCRVQVPIPGARDAVGYVRQDRLWGVYPDEELE
jgi:SH3-like domain-containing protein